MRICPNAAPTDRKTKGEEKKQQQQQIKMPETNKQKTLMQEIWNHTRTIFQFSYETDVSLLHIEEIEIS